MPVSQHVAARRIITAALRAGAAWINRVFGELAWDHEARKLPRATEAEIADADAALLTRAHAGPDRPRTGKAAKDRRVAARTKAARPSTPLPPAAPKPKPADKAAPEGPAESEELAEVIPLSLFDPLENPWRRS
ncbi:hypothetical protein ACH46L_31530 [Streptomyces althioticus]|uniref:hypothetical protein n=1 Tax=Streptomyces althioticus TaxID=83380 RepID=UPI00378F19F2